MANILQLVLFALSRISNLSQLFSFFFAQSNLTLRTVQMRKQFHVLHQPAKLAFYLWSNHFVSSLLSLHVSGKFISINQIAVWRKNEE